MDADLKDLINILGDGKSIVLCSRSTYSKLVKRFSNGQYFSNLFESINKGLKVIWIQDYKEENDINNIEILAKALKSR